MPPWDFSTGSALATYCQAMDTYAKGGIGAYGVGGWNTWTSDNVFCLLGAGEFWKIALYIALAFWGFFTVLQLFTVFDIQHAHGHALARAMQHLLGQVVIFFLALGSFFMLLLAHQLTWLIEDAIVGGNLPLWRVDAVWYGNLGITSSNGHVTPGALDIITAAQNAIGAPSGDAASSGGSNCASQGGNNVTLGCQSIFGIPLSNILFALAFTGQTILQGTGAIRFVVMLVLVGIAPVAIVCSGFHRFRMAVFTRWLEAWLELEGLAILTAFGIAGFEWVICGDSNLDCLKPLSTSQNPVVPGSLNGMSPMEAVFLMLGFVGVVAGLQIAYIWRLLGNMLTMGTDMYQAQYNRDVAESKANQNKWLGGLELIGDFANVIPIVGPYINAGLSLPNTYENYQRSTIPQANGFQGSTQAPLPSFDIKTIDSGGDDSSSSSGSSAGPSAGSATSPQIAAPATAASAPQPLTVNVRGGNTQTSFQVVQNRFQSIVQQVSGASGISPNTGSPSGDSALSPADGEAGLSAADLAALA